MPAWVAVTLCFLGLYLAFIIWAQANFGSYRYALRYLRGDRLEVYPSSMQSIGVRQAGEVLEMSVLVRNHGSKSVNVVGAIADCSCLATRGLPKRISPGGSASLPVAIRLPRTAGDWQQTVTYLTDVVQESVLRAEFTGRVEVR